MTTAARSILPPAVSAPSVPSASATPSAPAPSCSPWPPGCSPRTATPGARVDEIAEQTRTTKRMIYYYFGGKEQLYLAVLENAYLGIREAEQQLRTSTIWTRSRRSAGWPS